MNHPESRCPKCGTNLPAETRPSDCPKCLLQSGLESGTDFDSATYAETLPPSGDMDSQHTRPRLRDHHDQRANGEQGIGAYRDLQSVHDWSGGTVYRAIHRQLDRPVLLRVLDSSADQGTRDEFLRRAEMLSQVNHPNTVGTLEAGIDNGVAYVAEEFVDGQSLDGFLPRTRKERWAEGFYPNHELIRSMRDAALGLHAIHACGLSHQRLNPSSLLLDQNGIVRLVGLGTGSEANDDRFAMPKDLTAFATSEGVSKDIFRLGATFCFLVTGKLPTELDPTLSYSTLVRRIKKTNPGLTLDFCRVLGKCLDQRDPKATVPKPTVPDDNPYAGHSAADVRPNADADEIAAELSRLLLVRVQRADWRPRTYSTVLEGMLLFLAAGIAQYWSMRQYGTGFGTGPLWLTTLPFTLPIAYLILFETLFGWTPARRGFGFRLLNFAGEQPAWWCRLIRVVTKIVLCVLLETVPGFVAPAFAMSGIDLPLPLVMVCFVTWMFGAPFLLYATARLTASRWTLYDLLAGATWGEPIQLSPIETASGTSTVAKENQASITDRIDQFDIYEPVGSGGMGCVYRGRDRILGRVVAVKVLAEPMVRNPLLLERFGREARLAAQVNHPNVAKVFGNGLWKGTPYIAMEFVPGRNLAQIIKDEGRLPISRAWDMIHQAAEALRAADRQGVVHRDIKPANLMVDLEGRVKVTDFGVSRHVTIDPGVTDAGTIVGTPAYMAPEQAMGKTVDCRSDIYALGMTLYQMLSGRPPLKAASAVEMIALQLAETPPSLLSEVSDLTPEQESVLTKMIAKIPEDRYPSYDALLSDLDRYAPGVDRLANPLKRIAAEVLNWAAAHALFSIVALVFFLFAPKLDFLEAFGRFELAGIFVGVMLSMVATFIGTYIVSTARSGATSGKRFLGIRVIGIDGKRVGYARSTLRFVAAYPFVIVWVFMVTVGYFVQPNATWTPIFLYSPHVIQISLTTTSIVLLWRHSQRRTLHDLAAGTIVVRRADSTPQSVSVT